jgi:hypothetical protein
LREIIIGLLLNELGGEMDLERLKEVHSARAKFIEAANGNLPEAQKGVAEELRERFEALAQRMSKYVDHKFHGVKEGEYHPRQKSGVRHVGNFDGPMPEVYVGFSYAYSYNDGTMSSVSQGLDENEYGERIVSIRVDWIHSPLNGNTTPIESTTEVPQPGVHFYGEVFATEHLSLMDFRMLEHEHMDQVGMERTYGFHPSVKLALIEESLAVFEAAPPSPYEVREGLVSV